MSYCNLKCLLNTCTPAFSFFIYKVESDSIPGRVNQITFKIGIHSFLAWRSAKGQLHQAFIMCDWQVAANWLKTLKVLMSSPGYRILAKS